MPLHPQSQALLDLVATERRLELADTTAVMARDRLRAFLNSPGEILSPVGMVRDLSIPGDGGHRMAARAYTPRHAPAGPLPTLLFIHGGGWVAGDLEAYDPTCRELCNASGCLVVAIEYRLAPEHKFPAAPLDCYSALLWLASNAAWLGGDPHRIAVSGDSAGGNLAAVVAQMARDRGGPAIRFQLLVYPVTDHRFDTQSYRDCAEGYLLTAEGMRWNWGHYLPNDAAGRHPMASPLRAANFAWLPPALVITAEYDPLRDEGESYALRMRAAGVAVELRRYDGMLHAFFSLGRLFGTARVAMTHAGEALREAFVDRRHLHAAEM
jgi:acetyl esterase